MAMAEADFPALREFLNWPATRPLSADARERAASDPQGAFPMQRMPPRIRPAVRAKAPGARTDEAAASVASAALYSEPAIGRQQFDLAMDVPPIGQFRCQIALSPRGIEATFVVDDAQQRWLLSGQSDRLRSALSERGLRVQAVRVVQEGDPTAPQTGGEPP